MICGAVPFPRKNCRCGKCGREAVDQWQRQLVLFKYYRVAIELRVNNVETVLPMIMICTVTCAGEQRKENLHAPCVVRKAQLVW